MTAISQTDGRQKRYVTKRNMNTKTKSKPLKSRVKLINSRVDSDRLKPLSLHPLDIESALRAIIETGPIPVENRKPKAKKKARR
jgi:hypothetical protein